MGVLMNKKTKTKMAIADRAKQFMPFSALKGLETALQKKEREKTEQVSK